MWTPRTAPQGCFGSSCRRDAPLPLGGAPLQQHAQRVPPPARGRAAARGTGDTVFAKSLGPRRAAVSQMKSRDHRTVRRRMPGTFYLGGAPFLAARPLRFYFLGVLSVAASSGRVIHLDSARAGPNEVWRKNKPCQALPPVISSSHAFSRTRSCAHRVAKRLR